MTTATIRPGWPSFREWQQTHLSPRHRLVAEVRWAVHDRRTLAASHRAAMMRVTASVAAATDAYRQAAKAMAGIQRAASATAEDIARLSLELRSRSARP